MSVQADIEEYFKGVDYVVEATFEEQHFLWLTRHHHDVGLGHVEKWVDDGMGRGPTIAYVGRGKKARPIAISIFYATLDGLRVAFWSATSQLVDYAIIGKWIEERTDHIVDSDNVICRTDVANFNEILHAIVHRRSH